MEWISCFVFKFRCMKPNMVATLPEIISMFIILLTIHTLFEYSGIDSEVQHFNQLKIFKNINYRDIFFQRILLASLESQRLPSNMLEDTSVVSLVLLSSLPNVISVDVSCCYCYRAKASSAYQKMRDNGPSSRDTKTRRQARRVPTTQ